MFIAELITIAKLETSERPSTDEWIKLPYPYDGIFFIHKKEQNSARCYNTSEP